MQSTPRPTPYGLRRARRSFLRLIPALATAAAVAPHPARAAPGPGGAPPAAGGAVPHALAPDASPPFRAVAQRLMAAMVEHDVPGAALGIYAGGVEEHATFGVASVETQAPVAPDTLFQLGSLTKTYTATAIMRLVELGELDLDARVRTYLPALRLADESVAERVTVRHLLTHTGGWWGDYATDTGECDDAVERFVAVDLPTLEQLAPLGSFLSYNNSGFILLGRLLEVVTGRPYRNAVRDLLLRPLDLMESTFVPEEVRARAHADGHGRGNGRAEAVRPLFLPRNLDPAGGLWSTTREQLRYARFHLGEGAGRRLLRPETLALMQTPRVSIPGQAILQLGMNWFVQDLPGLRLVVHGGDTFGQHADLVLVPEAGFACVLLTNAEPAGAIAAQTVLLEALTRYGLFPAAPGDQAATPAVPRGPARSPDVLAQYAGRYRVPNAAFDLRVVDDTLVASIKPTLVPGQITPSIQPEVPPEAPLTFVQPDVAVVVVAGIPSPVFFVRRPDGRVGWISSGFRLVPRED